MSHCRALSTSRDSTLRTAPRLLHSLLVAPGRAAALVTGMPCRHWRQVASTAAARANASQTAAVAATTIHYVWWQTNRLIHIRPTPSTGLAAKLRVAGYGRPPVPKRTDEEMPVPFEAEPWFFVKTATRLIPPAQGVEALVTALEDVEKDLDMWLWQHSASVPPGPIEDGVS